MIADAADAPVMVVHLTNRKAFEEVMRARMNGQKVYAETCPQYLLLDDSVYSKPDFEGANTCVHLQSVRKQIRTACGKHWRMIRSRRLQLTSAALQWSRKLLVKMIHEDSGRAAGSTDERNSALYIRCTHRQDHAGTDVPSVK